MLETEMELIERILERYPDLSNLRPFRWTQGVDLRSDCVGLAVVPRSHFDLYRHLAVNDDEFRGRARAILSQRDTGRFNCDEPDAVLVFAEIQ
jgi:hypothetical protein